ncbi:MAG: MoaD/ThiS family protein [Ignavibacteriae bacterium]|nr:MoaD/ThiS family protein [Ignavibacteriota bacterium]
MKINVLFFGNLAELAQKTEIEIEGIVSTTELLAYIEFHYPRLMNSKFAIAVNKKISGQEVEFHDGDVVAFIPPFSGG